MARVQMNNSVAPRAEQHQSVQAFWRYDLNPRRTVRNALDFLLPHWQLATAVAN
jgi:hypothetical protein